MKMSLTEHRRHARQILDDTNPKDAPTAYYVLFHDPKRSAVYTTLNAEGKTEGVVGVFQTGQDLFRPLLTTVCRTTEAMQRLLRKALTVGRPYIFFANLNQLPLMPPDLHIENQRILQVLRLDSTRFEPQINVLVERKQTPDGLPRCEINMSHYQSVAGVNWQSPGFAEVYVRTAPEVRGRGWGRHVLNAVTDEVLRSGRQPIYLVEADNTASLRLAESVGYSDTGYRQLYADAVYVGPNGAADANQ
jgi:GNAT superfamily N-acetyltransferase